MNDHPTIQAALNDVPVYKTRVDATLAQADKYVKGQFNDVESRLDNICSQIAIDQSGTLAMQAHIKERDKHVDSHFARLVSAITELQGKLNELLNKPRQQVPEHAIHTPINAQPVVADLRETFTTQRQPASAFAHAEQQRLAAVAPPELSQAFPSVGLPHGICTTGTRL